ncbi:MAG: 3-hydroxyacyl-CoA dehydrogenase NAD-binding domain-containing protein [Chloroflexota bacterium]
MSEPITYDKDARNIVTLTLDMPGRSVNVINDEFGQAFAGALKRLAAEENLAGVILASAKKTFIAGAELEWLYGMKDAGTVFAKLEELKGQMRRLETMGKPVVAAINGTALGGGFEVALACHHRVAIDHPRTRLGLPEVTLGLLPGGGGVTRLTRMLGLQAAFPYLTEGQQLDPQQALAAGFVDELAADHDDMMAKARAWILANPESAQPWDNSGYRMPGGLPNHPKMAQMLILAPAMMRKKTYRNYPAPEAIMSAMVEGAAVDFDTASRIESRYFSRVATSQVAKNMINAFWFQLNEINGGGSRPDDIGPTETKKVGVLGAGLMGHGIAYVTAWAGMEVVLKDLTLARAKAGKAAIAELAGKRVSQGRMSQEEMQAILDRVVTTASAEDLRGCDLIVEAVFEDRKVKDQATREAEAQLDDDAVFGSNTSTLPITSLAESSSRPENFIGIHFFSPVHRMNLVEIIVGKKTSKRALAKAFDYVLKIHKIPIVVNDSRGFYTSRVFGAYVMEGMNLLAEGQHPRAIESAGLQAGMPMGPLEVGDMVGLNLAMHIHEQTIRDLAAEGKEMILQPAHAVLQQMVKIEGRHGRGAGAGFYEYPQAGDKHLWPKLYQLYERNAPRLSQAEMIERLMFVQALETVRCWEEGVVTLVANANIGSILGWGFAPFKGGTLQYLNDYGLPAFVARSRELAETYGERFSPPNLLIEMAEKGETF